MGNNIFFQYLAWQFLDVPRGFLKGWRNCLRFNLNYWSVPLLLKTFFSPWRRYAYSYGKGFDIKRYFNTFTFNLISRTLGAIMRTFFIVFGLLTELLVALAGAAGFLFCLTMPFLVISGTYYGFKILF